MFLLTKGVFNMSEIDKNKSIDELLENIASGWRSWTFSELDGTSIFADELKTIDKTVAEVKAQLYKLIRDEIVGKIQDNTDYGNAEYALFKLFNLTEEQE